MTRPDRKRVPSFFFFSFGRERERKKMLPAKRTGVVDLDGFNVVRCTRGVYDAAQDARI